MRARQSVTIVGELLFAALIYTALTLILGDTRTESIAWGFVVRHLLGNLIVVAAAGWYVANTDDAWWAVVAITGASLAAAQILVPHWETALMAGDGFVGLIVFSAKGVAAALGGALGLAVVLDLLDSRLLPPGLPGLFHRPSSYAWRLPALLLVYGLLQVIATSVVAALLPASWGRPSLVDMVVAHAACGFVWVGAVALVFLLLEDRSLFALGIAAAVLVVPGMVGRYLYLHSMPPVFWVLRIAFATLADGLVLSFAAYLLLPRPVPRQKRTKPVPAPDAG